MRTVRAGLALGSVLAGSAVAQLPTPLPTRVVFEEAESPAGGYDLADFGVADVDGDGTLDVFRTSHNMPMRLLLARNGSFTDVTQAWGLGAHPQIPGMASSFDPPPFDQPGLYIYFDRQQLHLRSTAAEKVGGTLRFARPVRHQSEGNATTRPEHQPSETLDFVLEQNATVDILPWFPKHRIEVSLSPTTALDAVFVGNPPSRAPSRRFELTQKDRHGIAWSDFDADGDLDAFIGVGGMVGMAPDDLRDQLLAREHDIFVDITETAGIDKQRGRSRRVEWVDFDGDGRLDLYVGNVKTPNQLWRQRTDGKFENVANDLGLDLRQGYVFRWFDVDADADPDLLVLDQQAAATLFINQGATFAEKPLADCAGIQPKHLSLADFDRDGDVDVFAADQGRNQVFIASAGSFECRPATELGLPGRSVTANWVDFDNDGVVDIHLVPGGLRRQRDDGKFFFVNMLFDHRTEQARCSWLDLDADGDRDCLCQVGREERAVDDVARINPMPRRHWLEIDVAGPPSNAQAIGAQVLVQTGKHRTRHVVGEAEGAHWSQGHYRIYVGLGDAERADTIDVTWPNGTKHRLSGVSADQRLTIDYPTQSQ